MCCGCVYDHAIDLFLKDITSLSCPWCKKDMHDEADADLDDVFLQIRENFTQAQ
jgi:hypothetical protein